MWLKASQTKGKNHPFCFTQSQVRVPVRVQEREREGGGGQSRVSRVPRQNLPPPSPSPSKAIQGRSLMPCQDTPSVRASFEFAITVPMPLVGIVSGNAVGGGVPEVDDERQVRTFRYEQTVPVMSYRVAILW